jgi:hypothetical protein
VPSERTNHFTTGFPNPTGKKYAVKPKTPAGIKNVKRLSRISVTAMSEIRTGITSNTPQAAMSRIAPGVNALGDVTSTFSMLELISCTGGCKAAKIAPNHPPAGF